ncbi:MAG: hypothetical protein JNL98_11505 [Bryobacterales bacterium]|nr:hypothetical protein [Bryobacterales bacterium]
MITRRRHVRAAFQRSRTNLAKAFAYFGRDAWEMEWVFYAIVAALAGVGAVVYGMFLESALKVANEQKEYYLRELSQTETPITSILQG